MHRSCRSATCGCATARTTSWPASTSTSAPARWSACSAPTAPARRPRSRSSRASGCGPAGEVRVLGEDPAAAGEAWRARTGVVLQSWRDHPRWTAAPAARPARRLLRAVLHPDAGAALGRGRAARHGRPDGARRPARSSPCRAGSGDGSTSPSGIIGRPELLFLDEPTAGFDPQARRDFHDLVHRLSDLENTTILLTTHDLDEAEKLADRILILAGGRIVADGSAEELARRVAGEAEVRWTRDGERFVHATADATPFVRDLFIQHGDEVHDLEVRRASLEDTYMSLVQQHEAGAATAAALRGGDPMNPHAAHAVAAGPQPRLDGVRAEPPQRPGPVASTCSRPCLTLGYLWIRRDAEVEGTDLLRRGRPAQHPRGLIAFGVVIGPAYALAMEREDGTLLRHRAIPTAARLLQRPAALPLPRLVPQLVVILVPSFLLFDGLMADPERLVDRGLGDGPRTARHAADRHGHRLARARASRRSAPGGCSRSWCWPGSPGSSTPSSSCGAGCRSWRRSSRRTGSASACGRRSCPTRPRPWRSAARGARGETVLVLGAWAVAGAARHPRRAAPDGPQADRLAGAGGPRGRACSGSSEPATPSTTGSPCSARSRASAGASSPTRSASTTRPSATSSAASTTRACTSPSGSPSSSAYPSR